MGKEVFPEVTEDEASQDGQIGFPVMGVANEAKTDLVDTDGDETRFATDKKGRAYTSLDTLNPDLHRFLLRADADTFGAGITMPRVNQIDIQFDEDDPENLTTVVTDTGSGSSSKVDGLAQINSGTDATVQYTLKSTRTIRYNAGHEIYLYQTVAWATPPTSAGDLAETGLYDPTTQDGYTWAYKGTSWGVRYVRNGSEISFTPQASFSDDPLDGSADSLFTRDGTPEAIDLTKINVFRIRFGWLSAAPMHFEVLAPDGHWVECHTIKHPNNRTNSQTFSPDLPGCVNVQKFGTDATDIQMTLGCWAGGVVSNISVAQDPDDKYVPVSVGGVDSDNTTSDLLGASETYRGTWFEWSRAGYSCLVFSVTADQAGTLFIDFSDDTTVTDGDDSSVDESITITIGAGDFLRRVTPVQSTWVRLRFVNGGVPQGDFSILTVFETESIPLVMTRLSETLQDTYLGGIVRNVQAAKNDAGTYGNILRSDSGGLRTSILEQEVELMNKATDTQSQTALTASTTFAQIDSSKLANRKYYSISNHAANVNAFYGVGAGTTVSLGTLLPPETTHLIEATGDVDIYVGTASSTAALSFHQHGGTV